MSEEEAYEAYVQWVSIVPEYDFKKFTDDSGDDYPTYEQLVNSTPNETSLPINTNVSLFDPLDGHRSTSLFSE